MINATKLLKRLYETQTRLAGILFLCNNDILLLQRSEAVDDPYMWSIPCGHVKDGESFWQGAKRETMEEAGLPASPYIVYHRNNIPDGTFMTFVVPVSYRTIPKLNWEHRAWKWASLKDFDKSEDSVHPGLIKTVRTLGLTL